MSAPLIALVGLIYLGVVVTEALRGNAGWAVAYFGYAIANVGWIMALPK
jgi:hypothetical protein